MTADTWFTKQIIRRLLNGNIMKKKVYVLRLSKKFLTGHRKAGQDTNFKELFLSGVKIHTIRSGEYWEKACREVNEGKAVISLRQWSAKPYASPDDPELACFHEIGWQPIDFLPDFTNSLFIGWNTLAKNDGLNINDFLNWFNYTAKKSTFSGGIIHFTKFRY